MNKDHQVTLIRKSHRENPCWNCKDWPYKMDGRCPECKTSPHQRVLDQQKLERDSKKPMNRVGKQGKANAKADKISKAEAERKSITYCQLCGSNYNPSRSHSHKRRHEQDLTRVAILCITPCHEFLENKLDHETRARINDFIIDTDYEGEYKFNKIVEMIPEHLREEFVRKIKRQ